MLKNRSAAQPRRNSGRARTNPVNCRVEDLNREPDDFKSSTLTTQPRRVRHTKGRFTPRHAHGPLTSFFFHVLIFIDEHEGQGRKGGITCCLYNLYRDLVHRHLPALQVFLVSFFSPIVPLLAVLDAPDHGVT